MADQFTEEQMREDLMRQQLQHQAATIDEQSAPKEAQWRRNARQLGGRFNESLTGMFGVSPEALPSAFRAPPAERAEERFYGAVGDELAMTTPALAIGQPMAGRVGSRALMPGAQPVQGGAAREMALHPTRAAGYETAAGITSGMGGQWAEELGFPYAAGQLGGALAPSVFGGSFRVGHQKFTSLNDVMPGWQRLGVEPTVGLGTKNHFYQGLENLLSLVPGGSGPMRKAGQRIEKALSARHTRIVSSLSRSKGGATATPEKAGIHIDRGLKEGHLGRWWGVQKHLYSSAEQLMDMNRWYFANDTAAALASTMKRIPQSPELNTIFRNPKMQQVLNAFENDMLNGKMPYPALKALRSEVGALLGDPELLADLPRAELKKVYAALSRDMEAAAAQNGVAKKYGARYFTDAQLAMRRANRYTSAGHTRLEDTLKKVWDKVDNLGYTPEEIYKAALSQADEGPTLIRTLRRSLTENEWRMVSSSVLRKMGQPAKGGIVDGMGQLYSAQTFFYNWMAMPATVKKQLFDHPGWGPTFIDDLNLIASKADDVRAAQSVFVEQTETIARQSALYTYGTIGGTSIAAAVGWTDWTPAIVALTMMTALNRTAAVLASPKTVHWLAQGFRLPAERLPGHVMRMKDIDESDPEVLDALREYASVLGIKDDSEAP